MATPPTGNGWLLIDTPGPGYAGAVSNHVAAIARTPSGQAMLQRLRASGVVTRIERAPVTSPPNAWAQRRDDGTVLIAFTPTDWPNAAQPGALPADMVLFGLLEHADALARGTPARDPTGAGAGAASAALEAYRRERRA